MQNERRSMRFFFMQYLLFGLVAAGIFPFYADLFVAWKPGMLKFFVAGCVLAGVFVGVANFLVFRAILKRLSLVVRESSATAFGGEFSWAPGQAGDLYDSLVDYFKTLIDSLARNRQTIDQAVLSLAQSLEELHGGIHQVNDKLGAISSKSEATSKQSSANEGVIANTVGGIDRISTLLFKTAQDMEHVSRIAEKIGQIVSLIDGIASKTNLLSINASVEAAKAGDHGRGFGVVAEEVKNLAAQSRAAGTEISDQIEGIQTAARLAVEEMRKGLERVRQEAAASQQAKEALAYITGAIRENIRQVDDLSRAVEAIAATSSRVEQTIQSFRAL